MKMHKKVFKILILLILISIYIYVALIHSNVFNVDFNYPDQKPYMDAAITIRTENFWYMGDRNRMPIYPYLMSFFYLPKDQAGSFFARGKLVNITLSLICLLVIYKVASRYLRRLSLVSFILIAAFALFVLKAPYFQVEIFFYTLFFLVFLLFIKVVQKPSLKSGVLVGIMVTLAYLTKATMLLGFSIFLGFLLIGGVIHALKKSEEKGKSYLLAFLSSLTIFFLLIAPYILENKKLYGRYFYNTGSTFYVWYDSIEEAYQESGTARNGETLGWPNLPADEIPSFSNYFKNHTVVQIPQRFAVGFLRTGLFLLRTYAVIPLSFLLFYLFFFIFIAYLHKSELIKLVKRQKDLSIFLATFFIGHLFAFSWYGVVDSGPRFMLTLFLPAFFVLIYLMEKITIKKNSHYFSLFHILTLIILFTSLRMLVIPILKTVYTGF